jgi:tetratricopeptide (TPR) repeat protein
MNLAVLRKLFLPRSAVFAGLPALVCALALCLPGSVRADALKDGKDALAAGRLDDAVTAYRSAVAANPSDAAAHLGLGLALERKRSWTAALDEFKKASDLDPRLADPYRGQGSTLLRLNRDAEAEIAFRKATEIDRKFPEAQLGLGEALTRQKKYDEAVQVLTEGIKFGTKTAPQFYEGLGHAESARDSLRAAEVWLLKAREAAPTNGSIHRSLGDLYMQRKIPQLAINEYNEAKTLDPNDLDTRMALGDAYFKGQLYNDALNEYKAVVDADPDYCEGYLKLGNLYVLASASDPQRVFQAIETLETLQQKCPDNLEGKALLAQAYFRKGGAEGRQKAQDLLNQIPKDKFPPAAYRTLAVIQYESRQFKEAIASFGKASRLETIDQFRVADAYRQLAADAPDSLAKAAFYDSAGVVYNRIVAVDSTSADGRKAQLERGKLGYLRKDYPTAVAELQRAIALDPKAGEAYYFLGLSQRALGDDQAGLAPLQKAVEIDPKKGGWWIQLGGLQLKLGDKAGALESFGKAAEVDSSTAGAVGLQQIGYQLLLEKDYPGAVQKLEDSAKRDAKQVMTWVWLGQASQNAGNKARAIESYKKALELKPGEPNAVKGLKSLGA